MDRATGPESAMLLPSDKTNTASQPEPREFLLRIAAAVGREALESCLQNLVGARAEEGKVILEMGDAGEFVRRQVKENLPDIAKAASKIVGSKVAVALAEQEPPRVSGYERVEDSPPSDDKLLEKVKREPVVRSFLDVFPGPVKAEKISHE